MAKSKHGVIVIDKDIVFSDAFKALKGYSVKVYIYFRTRLRMAKPKRHRRWIVENNGQIVFPYAEAEKLGITRPAFSRALDDLVEKGLIDITHSGNGQVKGDVSKYAISERWREFGKDSFIHKVRPKDRRCATLKKNKH